MMPVIASVTISALMRRSETSRPLTRPSSPPTRIASITAVTSALSSPCVCLTTIPAQSVMIAGTERSIPPPMITRAWPAEASASTPASPVAMRIDASWNTSGPVSAQASSSTPSANHTRR